MADDMADGTDRVASVKRAEPIADRIFNAITIDDDGCWIWPHLAKDTGYGRMWVGSRTDGTRRFGYAHRISYETFAADIPAGLQLDHLCRKPACCNPEHLEPVPPRENIARAPEQPSTINAAKTECLRGHPFTPSNTYMNKGKRYCRACLRTRNLASYHRTKERA